MAMSVGNGDERMRRCCDCRSALRDSLSAISSWSRRPNHVVDARLATETQVSRMVDTRMGTLSGSQLARSVRLSDGAIRAS